MKKMPILECIVITDVPPQRLAFVKSQDNQIQYRNDLVVLNRKLASNMPPLQAGCDINTAGASYASA